MKNYKLRRYVKMGLMYSVLTAIKEKPQYNGRIMDTDEMTYEDVKFVMKNLGELSTWEKIKEVFEVCFGMKDDDTEWFWNGRVVEFFEARNFIVKEFNRLIKQEQTLLKSIDTINTTLWEQAGGNKLNRFGGILALNQLGKLYGVYPFELKTQKYMEILVLLTIEKESSEIDKKFSELKSQLKKKMK